MYIFTTYLPKLVGDTAVSHIVFDGSGPPWVKSESLRSESHCNHIPWISQILVFHRQSFVSRKTFRQLIFLCGRGGWLCSNNCLSVLPFLSSLSLCILYFHFPRLNASKSSLIFTIPSRVRILPKYFFGKIRTKRMRNGALCDMYPYISFVHISLLVIMYKLEWSVLYSVVLVTMFPNVIYLNM